MQLTSIEYVIAVAETGNFTKAAERLYLSQPALSQSVKRLERELKVELFRRENNRVVLTPAGEILVEEGRKMLDLQRRIENRLRELGQMGSGKLAIGSAPSYQRYYLSKVISAFQSRYPHIQLTLEEGFTQELAVKLFNSEIDLALICEPIPHGLEYFRVFQEEIYLAIPPEHPLTKRFPTEGDPYPLADLSLCKDESFIVYRPGRRIADIVFSETKRAGFTPKVMTECSSTESANTMIRHGMGVGLVPSVTVELCPKEQHARYYRLRPEGLMRGFVLARKTGNYTSRAQEEFLALARGIE